MVSNLYFRGKQDSRYPYWNYSSNEKFEGLDLSSTISASVIAEDATPLWPTEESDEAKTDERPPQRLCGGDYL